MEIVRLNLHEKPTLNTTVNSANINDSEKVISENCNYDKKSLRPRKSNVTAYALGHDRSTELITFIKKFKISDGTIKTYIAGNGGSLYDISNSLEKASGFASRINPSEEFRGVIPICDGTNNPKKILTSTGDITKLGIDYPTSVPAASLTQLLLDDCETNWTACTNVTSSVDEFNYKKGSKSIKLEITDALATSKVVAFNTFSSSKDLTSYTAIKFYFRSSIDLNNSSFTIHLYTSTTDICGTDPYVVTLTIPAISAYTWTPVSITISDPSVLGDINAISVYHSGVDIGACTLWIDQIYAGNVGGQLGEAYFYKFNYYNSTTLKESSASAIFPNDSVGLECIYEKISLNNIPVSSDSQVDKKRIWRIGGTSTDYKLVATIDNSDTTYTDSTADSELGVTFNATYNDPPPILSHIKRHYDIFLGFGNPLHPNRIYWSEVNEPEYWGSGITNFKDLGVKITGHEVFGRTYLLFTENTIWAKEGEDNTDTGFYWRQTSSGIGNVPPNATEFYMAPIFVWWDGIYWFDGTNPIKLSGSIDTFFESTINKDKLNEAFSVVHDRQYRLAVCTGTNTYPDTIVILDFRNFSEDGVPRIRFEKYTIHSMYDDIYTGDLLGGINNELKTIGSGFTESVAFVDKTKDFGLEFNDRAIPFKDLKVLRSAWIWVNTKGYNLTIEVFADFASAYTQTINNSAMSREHINIDLSVDKFTFLSFKFSWTGIGEFEMLDSIDLGMGLVV